MYKAPKTAEEKEKDVKKLQVQFKKALTEMSKSIKPRKVFFKVVQDLTFIFALAESFGLEVDMENENAGFISTPGKMDIKKERKKVTEKRVAVVFTPDEYAVILDSAAKSGKDIKNYIKMEALK